MTMLIFVYGDDTFRVQEKVQFLRAEFARKHDPAGLNLAVFDATATPADVFGVLRSAPFMAQKRMVIVRDLIATAKKDAQDTWEKGFLNAPDFAIVVFWETLEVSACEKKSLFFKLKIATQVYGYALPQLEGQALHTWVASRVKDRGGAMATDAQKELVERVGADLWKMDHEIQKLMAYADGKEITRGMVVELVRASFEGEIFELVDALGKKQSKRALELLEEERWSGANDFYLMTMLARQLRLLIGARAWLDENPHATRADAAREMGVAPFVAQKALEQARGFTAEQLRAAHDRLFELDVEMKSGGVSTSLGVDLAAMEFLNKPLQNS